ncbi:MFS transporter [Oceanospirillum sanctuarii]|uniref:MFS transporter n=1 Tax=Oceanospirillum sanctuarii TaxID=1434821 RepID=UPI000A3D4D5A|nr:MFS transporter [Oceanospirillum sanctuarii]
MTGSVYWSLSSVYFFYFAVLGATNPYWGLYLQSLGFDAEQIGALMAVFIATKLIAPNLWSYWADRKDAHIPVMRLGAVLTPLCFLTVYLQQGFWSMAVAMVLYSFFWNAILPQYEVITLKAIKGREERYSQIRLWGSVGFIVAVAGLGWLLDWVEVSWLPVSILFIMVMMALSSWWIPASRFWSQKGDSDKESTGESERPSDEMGFWQRLRQPPVLVFLLTVILMQISHGPYYTFFSIYMEAIGYSRSLIGLLWSLGVMAEVVLFAIMHLLLRRFSAQTLLVISLILAAIRWCMIGFFAEHLVLLLVSQLLHAASFGSFHAASIALVQRFFTGKTAAQGQAVYSSLGFGIGGALGAWGSGLLWVEVGAQGSYLLAGFAAGFGAVLMLWSLWRQRVYWAAALS